MAGYYPRQPGIRRVFSLRMAGGLPIVTWMLLAINLLVWLAMELAGGSEDSDVLLDFGALFGPLIADGQYWRLFTAMFLHVGLMHLLVNALGLFIFGRVVEQVYGPLRFAGIYLVAGLSGSIASYLLNSIAIGAGASGAIFGVLGAFAAYFVARRRVLGAAGRQTLIGISVMAGINLLFGLSTQGVDNWAHIGGLAAGFAVGLTFVPKPEIPANVFRFPGFPTGTRRVYSSWWVLPLVIVILAAGTWLGAVTMPDNPYTHIYSSERLLDAGNYQEALNETALALDLDPHHSRAFLLRGKIFAELGERAQARDLLLLAVGVARNSGDQDTLDEAIELLTSLSGR